MRLATPRPPEGDDRREDWNRDAVMVWRLLIIVLGIVVVMTTKSVLDGTTAGLVVEKAPATPLGLPGPSDRILVQPGEIIVSPGSAGTGSGGMYHHPFGIMISMK